MDLTAVTARLFRSTSLAITVVVAITALIALPIRTAAADAPTLSGVLPASGPSAGGTEVTISGTGFLAGATVTFDGVAASDVVVDSASAIIATTPTGSVGPATIIVTNPDGKGAALNGAFVYLGPLPAISGISPDRGPTTGNTLVTITGIGFQAGATVQFGGVAATNVTVVNATRITVITPAHEPGAVTVEVRNPDTQSSTVADGFIFRAVPPPVVQSLSPSSGTTGGGALVTIVGTGFRAGALVRFGGVRATSETVVSATQISAITPVRSAGTVAVQVTNTDGQSGQLNNAFTYVSTPSPTVSGASPDSGPLGGGNVVMITGTGFLSGANVRFGGTSAPSVTVVSSSQLTAIAPAAGSPGSVRITVSNTDGKGGSRSNAYTYVRPPTVTGISPAVGPTLGGTRVTITGTNFFAGASVSFGDERASGVVVESATRITARTPAHSAGVSSVVVQSGGQRGTLPNAFIFRSPAVVSSVSPSSGPTVGGTRITIRGGGFADGLTVTVGGEPAANVAVISESEIGATTPARPSGSAEIAVRSTDGIIALGTPIFIYTVPPGTFDRPLVSTGVNPTIWNGGTVDQLASALRAQSAISATVFLGGRPVTLIAGAPSFVNAAFIAAYPSGLPAGVILLVVR